MTTSAAASSTASSSTTTDPSTTDQAISQMEAAFNQAIQTNAEITSIKTTLGSIETVAQQRPNIG
jgi:hypothetical protein